MNRNNDFCSGSALVYELLSEVCFNHFVLKVSTSVVQKAKPFAFSTQRPRGFRFFSSSLWKSRESVNRDRCVTRIDWRSILLVLLRSRRSGRLFVEPITCQDDRTRPEKQRETSQVGYIDRFLPLLLYFSKMRRISASSMRATRTRPPLP